MIRRKNKNGTQIDSTANGADGARVEISHPAWVNASLSASEGRTGLYLQNGVKLRNDYGKGVRVVTFSDGITLEAEESEFPLSPFSKQRAIWYTLGVPGLSTFFVLQDATGVPNINFPTGASSASATSPVERLSVHQFTNKLSAERVPIQVKVGPDQSIQFIHRDSTQITLRRSGEIDIQVKQGNNVTRVFTDRENIVAQVGGVNSVAQPNQVIVTQNNQVQAVVQQEEIVLPLQDGREVVQPLVGDAQVKFQDGNFAPVPAGNEPIQNLGGDQVVVVVDPPPQQLDRLRDFVSVHFLQVQAQNFHLGI